jgi:APA family basic amino acid/polyamine antiporter
MSLMSLPNRIRRSPITPAPSGQASLQKSIGPVQFGVLGFGSIVGTGWVVLLGAWLLQAGPGGAIVGIILAGAAAALIAAMYAELGSRFPQTGGEVTYITAVFGKKAGFVVGWLLTLAYLSVLVFESVLLAWLLGLLWPPLVGPVLYTSFGAPIGLGTSLISFGAAATIAYLNYRGARSFVRFQNTLTTVFLAIVLVILGLELCFGSDANLQPIWRAADGGSWLIGAAWVFGSAPIMFNGFQGVLHAIEERSEATSKDAVVCLCILAVGAAAVFYGLVVVAAARVAPWVTVASSELPAVEAIASLPWARLLRTAFLLALIASLLKTWSSVYMTSVRLIFAQAREGMIPACFGNVNPRTGAPGNATTVVAIVNFIGIFIGKGLLIAMISTTSLSIGLIYVLICAATLVARKRDPENVGFKAPGGYSAGFLAIASALGMAVFAFLQPAETTQADGVKWALIATWSLLGLGLYVACNRALSPAAAAPNSSDTGEVLRDARARQDIS